jgi:RNA polymerase sigma-70 factor (ECF subfamily)
MARAHGKVPWGSGGHDAEVLAVAESDNSLIAQAVQGDRSAFAELLERHAPAVRGSLSSRIPARWQALLSVDDVLQQTYTDAYLDLHQFRPSGDDSFEGWLTKIAHCNLLDAVRALEAEKRGGPRRPIPVDPGQDALDVLHDRLLRDHPRSTPSQHLARAEARAELRRVLEQLPDDYRRIIELYDLQGLPAGQVAEALSRSPGAIYLVRNRAHRRLRELLAGKSTIFRDLP